MIRMGLAEGTRLQSWALAIAYYTALYPQREPYPLSDDLYNTVFLCVTSLWAQAALSYIP